ncbi:hypothetical protein KAI37_02577 [Paenibacillus sp. S25]|nr:hypothetical protein KAI37_02577 [Paenibacillus sp. S25]
MEVCFRDTSSCSLTEERTCIFCLKQVKEYSSKIKILSHKKIIYCSF